MTEQSTEASTVRWFGIVLAIGQFAFLIFGIAALWRLGGGWWLGALAATIFVVIYGIIWSFWLAPGSSRRLAHRDRLLVNMVLGPIVLVVGGLTELWLPILVVISVIILCDALDERRSTSPAPGDIELV